MMNKITFLGTESVGVLYANPTFATLIERALGVRGYRVSKDDTVNPWLDGSGHSEMVATTGSLSKEDCDLLLFFTADEDTTDTAWEAIRLSFPEASSTLAKLSRPA